MKQQIKNNDSTKSMIVDLRGNIGGWIDEVKKALSAIFPPQTVIGEFIERDLDKKSLRVGSTSAYQGSVTVLIDGSSTSGAEVFAAAVQEFKRGQVIGQKSGGQVLNSIDKDLSGGFKLHIAFRDYKTVKGIRLEGTGVTPDLEIPFSIQDFRRQKDYVLEKTLETLNK